MLFAFSLGALIVLLVWGVKTPIRFNQRANGITFNFLADWVVAGCAAECANS
jgi:hypothetical protein